MTLEKLQGTTLGNNPPGPGKFEGNRDADLAEALHNATMEGFQDAELGDVEGMGWYGFMDLTGYHIKRESGDEIEAAIVSEDNNGFFDYQTFTSLAKAKAQWSQLEIEEQEYYKDSDDGLDDSGTMSISNIIIILVIILGVVIALRFMVKADNTTETRQIWMRPGTQSTEGPI